ncbi:MAG TPA: hypothetical protein VHV08_17700, partial [Pirellulales bacterium]|nr:hypothetical protein [Pirellulales bacterium]
MSIKIPWSLQNRLVAATALGAISVSIVAVAFYLMSRERDYTIEFMVPTDYRGTIIAELDERRGQEPHIKNN